MFGGQGHGAQLRYARRLSSSFNLIDFLKITVNSIIRRHYPRNSLHRTQVCCTELPAGTCWGLQDLVYGKKYYVLQRLNRKNDLGKREWHLFSSCISTTRNTGLRCSCFDSFDVPFISLDIAMHEGRFVLHRIPVSKLRELHPGTLAVLLQSHGRKPLDRLEETPDLEREFVASVVRYIDLHPEA